MEATITGSSSMVWSSESDDDRSRRCCKKQKSAADTDVAEEEDDIISRLPDEILCNILSSFSTKESVRTSILSKRWRYVWTSIPNLVFDDDEYLHHPRHIKFCDIKNCFEQFMNSVLHNHNNLSCIQKFHLSTSFRYGLSTVNEWINTAIGVARPNIEEIDTAIGFARPNIEEIDVNDSLNSDVELSSSFFTSNKKLMVLKLCPHFFLNVPTSGVNFPNLKIVRLNEVKFADDDSVKKFVSGCPVLEEFDISICCRGNLRNLHIQSSSLKKLTVSLFSNYERDFEFGLVIESPNLQYLDLVDFVTEDCSIVNFLSSLVEVHLSVTQDPLVNEDIYNNRFIKLLLNISNAKHLELWSWISAFRDLGNLPVSLNLTYLKVEVEGDSWGVLPFLLNLSPNLRTFYIGKLVDYFSPCGCKWESPHCIPKCLLFCLEEIEITGFEACDNEIEMVEYFLKNGRVLKKMSIEFVQLLSKKYSYVREKEKLLAFPKASGTCTISFSVL